MEKNNDFQVLQDALRAMVRMHRDYADLLATLLTIFGSMDPQNLSVVPWEFTENDYSSLVLWIISTPGVEQWQRHSHEPWTRYATRLSKFVGWNVDSDKLRRRFYSKLKQLELATRKK